MAPKRTAKKRRWTSNPSQKKRRRTRQPTHTNSPDPERDHDPASETFWAATRILQDNGTHYLIEWEDIDPATGEPYTPTWEPHDFVTPALKEGWMEARAPRSITERGGQNQDSSYEEASDRDMFPEILPELVTVTHLTTPVQAPTERVLRSPSASIAPLQQNNPDLLSCGVVLGTHTLNDSASYSTTTTREISGSNQTSSAVESDVSNRDEEGPSLTDPSVLAVLNSSRILPPAPTERDDSVAIIQQSSKLEIKEEVQEVEGLENPAQSLEQAGGLPAPTEQAEHVEVIQQSSQLKVKEEVQEVEGLESPAQSLEQAGGLPAPIEQAEPVEVIQQSSQLEVKEEVQEVEGLQSPAQSLEQAGGLPAPTEQAESVEVIQQSSQIEVKEEAQEVEGLESPAGPLEQAGRESLGTQTRIADENQLTLSSQFAGEGPNKVGERQETHDKSPIRRPSPPRLASEALRGLPDISAQAELVFQRETHTETAALVLPSADTVEEQGQIPASQEQSPEGLSEQHEAYSELVIQSALALAETSEDYHEFANIPVISEQPTSLLLDEGGLTEQPTMECTHTSLGSSDNTQIQRSEASPQLIMGGLSWNGAGQSQDGLVAAPYSLSGPYASVNYGSPPNNIYQSQPQNMELIQQRTLPSTFQSEPNRRSTTSPYVSPYYDSRELQSHDLQSKELVHSGVTDLTQAEIHVESKKTKRRSMNRTNTGCITCRGRRRKCDEGKPQCDTCTRGGFVCEGYISKPQSPKNGVTEPPSSSQTKEQIATNTLWSTSRNQAYSLAHILNHDDSLDNSHDTSHDHHHVTHPVRNRSISPHAPRVYYATLSSISPLVTHPTEAVAVAHLQTAQHPLMTLSAAVPLGPSLHCVPDQNIYKTEKQKMLDGEPFMPYNVQLVNERMQCKLALYHFNSTSDAAVKMTQSEHEQSLKQIVEAGWVQPFGTERLVGGYFGSGVHVATPFHCDYGYNIFVGDNVIIGPNCQLLDSNKIVIGKNTTIGARVTIMTLETPTNTRTLKGSKGTEVAKEVYIGNNVNVGDGCIIEAGVRIGNGAIVRPGSVVAHDIPPHCIALGNPVHYT